MKIKRIAISNFRCIKSAKIDAENYNAYVGANGSGKSSVLAALNIFFGEINSFTEEDFFAKNTEEKISITVTFEDLSPAAMEEFKHYVRENALVVTAEISKTIAGFERKIRGQRLIYEPLAVFFKKGSAAEKKTIFDELREKYPQIANATTNDGREKALREYEEMVPPEEKQLTISEDDFFGISRGVHKFQRHLHWVYIPAVKEANTESLEAKTSHLGKLIQHTVRATMDYEAEIEKIKAAALTAYDALIVSQKTHLSNLEKRLANRLKAAVTSDADLKLDWKRDEKSVTVLDPLAIVQLSDKGYIGSVENFGHGLQRTFLIAILQELMAVDSAVSPTLILGCEEPELYQHPPQAKHLASILMELSAADAQVFITTHSPHFIDVDHYSGIKVFRNGTEGTNITSSSFSSIIGSYNTAFAKKITSEDQARAKLAIQLIPKFNELFFADKVVLVEGISDQACIEAYLRVSGRKPEFVRSGACILVCEGKSSLALLVLIARAFGIPHHVVFDCDANCDPNKSTEHIRDNDAIFSLLDLPKLEALPTGRILSKNVTAWLNQIDDVFEEQLGEHLESARQAGRDAVGNISSAKKHPIYISAATRDAWEKGQRFPVFEEIVSNMMGR